MDIRETPYPDNNSSLALFDGAMSGIGISMLVAIGFAVVNLLF
jgi:hypothetical protein